MVIIKKASQEDINSIKTILREAKCNISDFNDNNIMVVEEDTQLVGVGCIKIFGELAFIEGIAMKDNDPELSDGLVKALINFADRRDVKEIYTLDNKQKSIYQEIGFIVATEQQCKKLFDKTGNINFSEKLLILDVNDFFNNHQCKSQ